MKITVNRHSNINLTDLLRLIDITNKQRIFEVRKLIWLSIDGFRSSAI